MLSKNFYKQKTPCLFSFIFVFFSFSPIFANELQNKINTAESGAILTLEQKIYDGNIKIDKNITIIGKSGTIIKGNGEGNVIYIKANGVVLENLTIQNSGKADAMLDSGIYVKDSSSIRIANNKITDTLFGIVLDFVNDSNITGNYIESYPLPLGERGDGITMFSGIGNEISHNRTHKVRDSVIWRSSGNIFYKNHSDFSRYGLHFMYAGANIVDGNTYTNNSVGAFFMYSEDSIVKNNIIKSQIDVGGIGIGMKDTSNFTIENNDITYNTAGIFIEHSPMQGNNHIKNNNFSFNHTAVWFSEHNGGNIFANNDFYGNVNIATNEVAESKVLDNVWESNAYDVYEGLDRDKDGVGDMPYTYLVYADRLYSANPSVKFFYGSFSIAFLDFVAKILPFSPPIPLFTDKTPRISKTMIKVQK